MGLLVMQVMKSGGGVGGKLGGEHGCVGFWIHCRRREMVDKQVEMVKVRRWEKGGRVVEGEMIVEDEVVDEEESEMELGRELGKDEEGKDVD
jgi:hypothetical protein